MIWGLYPSFYKAHKDILVDCSLEIDYPKSQPKPEGASGMFYAPKDAVIEPGASLHNCILLDGAIARAGELYHNEVIGRDYSLNGKLEMLKELPIIQPFLQDHIRISSLKEQGSDRSFFRVHTNPSQVLMVSSQEDNDFSRFIALSSFFRDRGITVPEIYQVDLDNHSLLMQDGGNETLFDIITAGRMETSHLDAVIDQLVELVSLSEYTDCVAAGHLRIFDFQYLRWESDYFTEYFLQMFCDVPQQEITLLIPFYDRLAESVLKLPQVVIHRDFQSQNIVFNDHSICLVDFQGARVGALGFDIASFVFDPYISLDDKMIQYCLERYRSAVETKLNCNIDLDYAVMLTSLQRLMQALGAYCFLSLVKRKRQYLAFIEPAVQRLKEQLNLYLKSVPQ